MSFHETIPFDAIAPPSLSQSRLYAQVLRQMGRDVLQLDLGGVGLVRLVLRDMGRFGRIALMPGGPNWRQSTTMTMTMRRDALSILPQVIRPHRIRALITNCADPFEDRTLRLGGHLPLITGGHHARLNLSETSKTRCDRMNGKWRNRLRHAEKQGITINRTQFNPRHHDWLFDAEAEQRRTRRYRNLPFSFVSAASAIAPEQVQLFIASKKGNRLGAMLFLMHERAATYHIGHVTAPGRAVSAHNLLLWQASNWLARKGVAWIDLGPVDTESAPGLARFKLGSGADVITRGSSCLYSPLTIPIGWLNTRFNSKALGATAARTGRSFH